MAHSVSDYGTGTRLGFRDHATIFLFKRVSKHAQRIFFLASLGGQFNHYATQRRMAMVKLNEAMQLSYREDAIKLPMYLSQRVWGGTGLEDILTEESLESASRQGKLEVLAGQVVDVARDWAHYASRDEMIGDVTELLKHHCMELKERSAREHAVA
jgi:hypothetical protein